jgi:alginate O-acetyltransferase complex protein AlgI
MVFSSPIFLFGFLPVCLLYHLAPPRARNLVLLAASLFFYAWGEKEFVLLMLGAIGVNYAFGRWVESAGPGRAGAWALGLGVTVNLLALIAFKYSNFLCDNLDVLLGLAGLPRIHLKPVHLPIGISFFTFEAVSYLVDIRRRQTDAQKSVPRFALYMTLFPHLIAGPIVRYSDVAAQIASRTVTTAGFAEGVRRFVLGLSKKMLLANPLAVTADAVFALPTGELGTSAAWLGILCYTLQIYFDFSGYSDMAIGLGKMVGFDFVENFRYPYSATSITDFWRRWHISLSTWFRDYLYIPLGGNRVGPWKTARNLFAVFLLCGLWHGASWNFLIWGAYHGLFLVLERVGLGRLLERFGPLRHAYVALAVMGGWVFFRAETLPAAGTFLAAMAGLNAGCFGAADYLTAELMLVLLVALIGCLPTVPWLVARWEKWQAGMQGSWGWSVGVAGELTGLAALAALLLGSASQLAAGSYSPFLYFRF